MVRLRLFVLVLCAAAGMCCRRAPADTVLLDFTQPNCGPCAEMEPVLRQLAGEGVRIQRIDVQRDPRVAAQYRVDLTPTYIVLVDGREWARLPGKGSHALMVQMIAKAQSLAAQGAPQASRKARDETIAPIDFSATAPAPDPFNVAAHSASAAPQDGRLVPIQDPFAVRTPPRSQPAATGAAPGAGTPRRAASGPAAGQADAANLISATVRLSIADPNGKSTGTGAIVDARNGMALVLTCGHLFRESNGQGAIEISLFTAGPHGATLRGTVEGELFDCDLERDLALVRFRTESRVAVTPVAPPGTLLLPGAPVTSVGCNHGADPTAVASTIKSVNRYQGYPNVEVAGAPVEGRSGGGLFNAEGQLVGICNLAEPQDDEGIYAALKSIHDKLDSLQLATVYTSPSTGPAAVGLATAENQLAAAPSQEFAVRGQDPATSQPATLSESLPGRSAPSANLAAAEANVAAVPAATGAPTAAPATNAAALAASLTPQEQVTLEEIARRSGGGEVICIIQPHSPDSRSDVIKLSGVSPAFVRALAAAANEAAVQTPLPAASPAMAAAPSGTLR